MVIFYSYVSLPEGKTHQHEHQQEQLLSSKLT